MTKTTLISIKDWNHDDRPREKLAQKGSSSLSNAELIAILIGSGNRNENAVALGRRILASYSNNLNELGRLTIEDLKQFEGIGEVKAITILAALELRKRQGQDEGLKKSKITSSKTVYELLHPILGDLTHEEFWIIYLNNSNKVLQLVQLSKGGITGTLVDVRLVYKHALKLGAVAIILAHNHPSGNLTPSEADRNLTIKLKNAGENLDIKVLDHLIITENMYFSFADENLL